MVAGEQNHLAVAEFLIARGADVSHPEIHGYLPITRALFKGNTHPFAGACADNMSARKNARRWPENTPGAGAGDEISVTAGCANRCGKSTTRPQGKGR